MRRDFAVCTIRRDRRTSVAAGSLDLVIVRSNNAMPAAVTALLERRLDLGLLNPNGFYEPFDLADDVFAFNPHVG